MKYTDPILEYVVFKSLNNAILTHEVIKQKEKTLATLILLMEDSSADALEKYIIDLSLRDFGTNCTYVHSSGEKVTIVDALKYPLDHSTDFITTMPQLLRFIHERQAVLGCNPPYILVALDSNKELHVVGYEREGDLPSFAENE